MRDTFGWMDTVEDDVGDPGQDEAAPANGQQFVAERPVLPQDLSVAALVHQGEALAGVQPHQAVHGQTQQEDEEQTEVESLSHQGGLVQDLLLVVLVLVRHSQQSLVVVVVVGEDTGERVHDQPWDGYNVSW